MLTTTEPRDLIAELRAIMARLDNLLDTVDFISGDACSVITGRGGAMDHLLGMAKQKDANHEGIDAVTAKLWDIRNDLDRVPQAIATGEAIYGDLQRMIDLLAS